MKTKRVLLDDVDSIDDGIAFLILAILLAPWACACLYVLINLFHPAGN